MCRLIDAERLYAFTQGYTSATAIRRAIREAPTVRSGNEAKRAFWADLLTPPMGKSGTPWHYRGCSLCGGAIPTDTMFDGVYEPDMRYCPYCGAKMDENDSSGLAEAKEERTVACTKETMPA